MRLKGSLTLLLFLLIPLLIIAFSFTDSYSQTADQVISLKQGFNFISLTVSPTITPVELKQNNSALVEDIYLYSAAAGSFLSLSEGTLSSIAAGKGYIIKAKSEGTLTVSGSVIQTVGNISLKAGFNLIGLSQSVSANSFSNLMKSFGVIKGIYKWSPAAGSFIQVIRNPYGTSELIDGTDPQFKAGEAYFINLYADGSFKQENGAIILTSSITGRAAQPLISPVTGNYSSSQSITISCVTDGAIIKYTTDGSSPSATNGSTYSAPFTVSSSTTIKAVSIKSDMVDSETASNVITINLPSVATPVFSVQSGTYKSSQSITITCATSNADIYYTTDGSAPDSSKTKYSSVFTLSQSAMINAIALKTGMTPSTPAAITLTIDTTAPAQSLTIATEQITNVSQDNTVSATNSTMSVNLVVPANTFSSASQVTIGEVTSQIPVKEELVASSITQAIPPVEIRIEADRAPAQQLYVDIPLSKVENSTNKLLVTYYDGKTTKYLPGTIEGQNYRVFIPAEYLANNTQTAPKIQRSPDKQILLALITVGVISYLYYDNIISFAKGTKNFIEDKLGLVENRNVIQGTISVDKPNILLTHGILSQVRALGNGTQNSLIDFLKNKGYNVMTFNYQCWDSNIDNGKALANEIIRVEAATASPQPITIVAHSMGGLVAREALRSLGENGEGTKPKYVNRILFLSTPNRGGKLLGGALGDWQEFLNASFLTLAVTMNPSWASGFVVSTTIDNWPLGVLQLVADKSDGKTYLKRINDDAANFDFSNVTYCAMYDKLDEVVDESSINLSTSSSIYPYNGHEKYSQFNFISTNYDIQSGLTNNHSATHNIGIPQVETDMLKLLKSLSGITLSKSTDTIIAGETYDLSKISVTARYINNNINPDELILNSNVTWKNSSGETITNYTAPQSITSPIVLTANYTEMGITRTANLTLIITSSAQSNQLIGWWKFDEGSGMVVSDNSGNNITLNTQNTTWVDGIKGGKALNFNGTSSSVKATVDSKFSLSKITLSAWVKSTGNGSINPRIIAVGPAGTSSQTYAMILKDSTKQLWFFCANDPNSYDILATKSVLPDNLWHQLTITYDGLQTKFYIDSVLDKTITKMLVIPQFESAILQIGYSEYPSPYTDRFQGAIDDVKIYNYALSEAEIQQYYNSTKPSDTIISPPTFNPPTGTTFDSVLYPVPSTTTAGATIRYTTDGSTPSATNGTTFGAGNIINLTATTTVKAVAIKDGILSEVATATYTKTSATATGQTLTLDLGGGVMLEMVKIASAGKSFQMGSPNTEQDRVWDEGPTHTVSFTKDYYIGKYELTQGQWKVIMSGTNPSYFQNGDNYPVEQVSWEDISAASTGFLAKLNQLAPVGYSGFRLPTEAEWEFAARGGTQTSFHWGDDSSYSLIGNYAWYGGNSSSKTHPVGEKLPNAFGLYDMSGNVSEWCSDWYGSYSSSAVTDPTGPVTDSARVIRGGCWYFTADRCRLAIRGSNTGALPRISVLGFRLALPSGQ